MVQKGRWVLIQRETNPSNIKPSSYFKPRCISFLRGAGPPQYPLETKVVSSRFIYVLLKDLGKVFFVYSCKTPHLQRDEW